MIEFSAIWEYLVDSQMMKKICNLKRQAAIKATFEEACEIMENEQHIRSTAFTPHGRSHCLDILKIINNMFFSAQISELEWTCLLIAVAWHDVGMHGDIVTNMERENHARVAAAQCKEFIRKKPAGKIITENLQSCICEIIEGHSGRPLFNIGEQRECYGEKIRVRLLAAILRFSDELDICSERLIGEKQVYDEFAEGKTEQETIKRRISFACWEQCAIFLMPQRDGESIQLRVALDNVKKRLNKKYTISKDEQDKNIYDLIERHLKKVEKSLFEDRVKDVFDSYAFDYGWVQNIEIVGQDQDIPNQTIDNIKRRIKGIKHNLEAKNMYEARLLLRNAIKEQELRGKEETFEPGNSQINLIGEKINTYQLIQHDEKNIIPQIMYKAFGNLDERLKLDGDKVVVLGVDDLGWILSSSLALMFNIPFEMVVSQHHEKYAEKKFLKRKDSLQEFIKEKELILVIDTIYTFTTVIDIIEKYNLNRERFLAVVCLFDRKPYPMDEEDELYKNLKAQGKIFAVSDDDKVRYKII